MTCKCACVFVYSADPGYPVPAQKRASHNLIPCLTALNSALIPALRVCLCFTVQTQETASRGRTLATPEDREVAHVLPDKADMFIAYATVPGFT